MAMWPLNYKASQCHSIAGRLQCLSRQNSTIPPGAALALQQLSSFALLLYQFGCTTHFLDSFAQCDSHSTQVFFSPTNMLQRLFWMLKVRVPIAQCTPKGCLEAQSDLSWSELPLLVCECFHLLFSRSECFMWSELLTTSPQHHPKRRSHLQITFFFP